MPSQNLPQKLLDLVQRHLQAILATGTAAIGPDPSPMWLSSLDTDTGRYPADDARPADIPKRVYRNIDAPRGCSLYWDQPSLLAAHALSAATGQGLYADAATAYIDAFLARCVAANGILLWGNHYYWDAFAGVTRRFLSNEPPAVVDLATEDGQLHEARPIPPAWELFWRVSPQATERAIRAIADAHLFDPAAGGFNRHANRDRGHAFIESGGILVQGLCWLAARTGDTSLADQAARIANFSWSQRNMNTGLVPNDRTGGRWDGLVSTTEIGLWAGCLLRAGDLVARPEFAAMAAGAVEAFLRFGFDQAAGQYFGRVQIADGVADRRPKSTVYQPGEHTDLWEPLFPAHDYPMCLAQTCLELHRRTGRPVFAEAVERFMTMIRRSLPARGGRGGYAEHYGRCLHFALCVARATGSGEHRQLADDLAREAIDTLWAGRMFRGHPGENRYDAVDGVGYLLLALLELELGGDTGAGIW